ncbi:hypothetical protein [Geodermatophilus sp. SYSU D00710]
MDITTVDDRHLYRGRVVVQTWRTRRGSWNSRGGSSGSGLPAG